MGLVISLLTLLLILNSLFLMLLVLIQLPKKEAGAGLAFGAGTTDALFGAGSGTVLTRVTKYATGVFLLLCLGVSVLYTHQARASRSSVLKAIDAQATAAIPTNVAPPVLPLTLSNAPAIPIPAPVPAATGSTAQPTVVPANAAPAVAPSNTAPAVAPPPAPAAATNTAVPPVTPGR
jgi:preprotein translocase subunit SecG